MLSIRIDIRPQSAKYTNLKKVSLFWKTKEKVQLVRTLLRNKNRDKEEKLNKVENSKISNKCYNKDRNSDSRIKTNKYTDILINRTKHIMTDRGKAANKNNQDSTNESWAAITSRKDKLNLFMNLKNRQI